MLDSAHCCCSHIHAFAFISTWSSCLILFIFVVCVGRRICWADAPSVGWVSRESSSQRKEQLMLMLHRGRCNSDLTQIRVNLKLKWFVAIQTRVDCFPLSRLLTVPQTPPRCPLHCVVPSVVCMCSFVCWLIRCLDGCWSKFSWKRGKWIRNTWIEDSSERRNDILYIHINYAYE